MNRRATFTAALAATLLLCTASIPVGAQPAPASRDAKAVRSGTYAVEPSHTRVQFTVSHMGLTDWYGDFTGISGSLNLDPNNLGASRLDIVIPVTSVSTTNATLDGELKGGDWFDAKAFPTIRFVSSRVVRTGPAKATIYGRLTLHGVTKPVALAASFNGAGVNPMSKAYTIGFNASTSIRRSDFGVKKYVPLIGDRIDIRISAAFERQRS